MKIRQREENAVSKTELFFLRLGRWATMLAHELFKDEVKIRAESLSFLMVFSLLPLIAGGFFLFNIFAKFGFVQDALRGAIDNLLLSIPYEHREIVSQYVTQFANTYWDSVSSKSGSIGIFALFILLWVGLSTFNNIDRTLNHIWSSHRERPFFEKFRNFLVTMVLAPIVLVSALSIPLILLKMDIGAFVVEKFPLIPFLVNALLFPLLGWLTFTLIYKYTPVSGVRWKSAFFGAMFSTASLQIVNSAMQLYFRYGTNSAYGKAAVVPLILFWIYLMWLVLILGAEVSYLMQTDVEAFEDPDAEHSIRDGGNLITMMLTLLDAYKSGRGPLTFFELKAEGRWTDARMNRMLDYAVNKGWVVRCAGISDFSGNFVLARDITNISVAEVLKEFLSGENQVARRFDAVWKASLAHWLAFFEDQTFGTMALEKEKSDKPKKRR